MEERNFHHGNRNQTEIQCALPAKNGVYDFLQLSHQVNEAANAHRQAAEVINVVTGSKLKYPEGKGDVNMCLAIQQMREESELTGQIKGAVIMCKDLGVSLTETIKRIAEKFQLSEIESSEKVTQYW